MASGMSLHAPKCFIQRGAAFAPFSHSASLSPPPRRTARVSRHARVVRSEASGNRHSQAQLGNERVSITLEFSLAPSWRRFLSTSFPSELANESKRVRVRGTVTSAARSATPRAYIRPAPRAGARLALRRPRIAAWAWFLRGRLQAVAFAASELSFRHVVRLCERAAEPRDALGNAC